MSILSQTMTLEPGDLILTGTPPGVGQSRTPNIFLRPGDEVVVSIDRWAHCATRSSRRQRLSTHRAGRPGRAQPAARQTDGGEP